MGELEAFDAAFVQMCKKEGVILLSSRSKAVYQAGKGWKDCKYGIPGSKETCGAALSLCSIEICCGGIFEVTGHGSCKEWNKHKLCLSRIRENIDA